MQSEYHKRSAAARSAGIALTRRQQDQLTSDLQGYADELSRIVNSPRNNTNSQTMLREITGLLDQMETGLLQLVTRSSTLEARTLATMHAQAHAAAMEAVGLSADPYASQITGSSARLAQAVIARDGVAESFTSIRRRAAKQTQMILRQQAVRGGDLREIERPMRMLILGAEDIPDEFLEDRRIISKRTLEEYMGIAEPTHAEVQSMRNAAGIVANRARLIARAEMANTEREVEAIAMAESPIVAGGIWFTSNRHNRPDQCDVLRDSDFYGLGAGHYPSNAIPIRPHPRCLCGLTHFLRPASEWGEPKQPSPKLRLNPKKAAKALGLSKSQQNSVRQAITVGEARRSIVEFRDQSAVKQALAVGQKAVKIAGVEKRLKRTLGQATIDAAGIISIDLSRKVKLGLSLRALSSAILKYRDVIGPLAVAAPIAPAAALALKIQLRKQAKAAARDALALAKIARKDKDIAKRLRKLAAEQARASGIPLADVPAAVAAQRATEAATVSARAVRAAKAKTRRLERTAVAVSAAGTLAQLARQKFARQVGRTGVRLEVGTHAQYLKRYAASYDADGKPVFRRTTRPPVHGGRNLEKNMEEMGQWLSEQNVEHYAAYHATGPDKGKLALLVQGRASDVALPRGVDHSRLISIHNHPPWASDYTDARTFYSIGPSALDLSATLKTGEHAARVRTPFHTFTLRPRDYDINWGGAGGQQGTGWEARNAFEWHATSFFDGSAQGAANVEWVTGVSPTTRLSNLHYRFETGLRSRPTHLSTIWKARNDKSFERYKVFDDANEEFFASLARGERAVTEMQFEAIIRHEIHQVIAEEYGWIYERIPVKNPVILPHRDILKPIVIDEFSDLHGTHAFLARNIEQVYDGDQIRLVLQQKAQHFVENIHFAATVEFRRKFFPSHGGDMPGSNVWRSIRQEIAEHNKGPSVSVAERKSIAESLHRITAGAYDGVATSDMAARLLSVRDRIHNFPVLDKQLAALPVQLARDIWGRVPLSVATTVNALTDPDNWLEAIENLLGPLRAAGLPDNFLDIMPPNMLLSDRLHMFEAIKRRAGITKKAPPFPLLVRPLPDGDEFHSNLNLIDQWLTPQSHEAAFVLDRQGRPILFRQGSAATVPLSQLDEELIEGNWLIHNHTPDAGDLSFGAQDLSALTRTKARGGILLTRSYRHQIEMADGSNLRGPFALSEWDDLFGAELNAVLTEHVVIKEAADRVKLPATDARLALTFNEAEELATHGAMTKLANQRGWTYQRGGRGQPIVSAPTRPLPTAAALRAERTVTHSGKRVALLREKVDDLRREALVAKATGETERAAEALARANGIEGLMAANVDPAGTHLNVPRWIRRSRQQIDAAFERGQEMLEDINAHFGGAASQFDTHHFRNFPQVTEDDGLKWLKDRTQTLRDKTFPRMREAGYPTKPIRTAAGTYEQPIIPFTSARRTAEYMARDMKFTEVEAWRAIFDEEFDFLMSASARDEIREWADASDGIEAFTFGATYTPDGARSLAKRIGQYKVGESVVEQSSDIIDFYKRVAIHGIEINELEFDDIINELLQSTSQWANGREFFSNRSISNVMDVVSREPTLAEDVIKLWQKGAAELPASLEKSAFARAALEHLDKTGDADFLRRAARLRKQKFLNHPWGGSRHVGDPSSARMQREIMEKLLGRDLRGEDIVAVFTEHLDVSPTWKDDFAEVMVEWIFREEAEKMAASVSDGWAQAASGTLEAAALQLAVDAEMGLVRSAKRHLIRQGIGAKPSITNFASNYSQRHSVLVADNLITTQNFHAAKLYSQLYDAAIDAKISPLPHGATYTDLVALLVDEVDELGERLRLGDRSIEHALAKHTVHDITTREGLTKALAGVMYNHRTIASGSQDFLFTGQVNARFGPRTPSSIRQSIAGFLQQSTNEATHNRRILKSFVGQHNAPLPGPLVAALDRKQRLNEFIITLDESVVSLENRMNDLLESIGSRLRNTMTQTIVTSELQDEYLLGREFLRAWNAKVVGPGSALGDGPISRAAFGTDRSISSIHQFVDDVQEHLGVTIPLKLKANTLREVTATTRLELTARSRAGFESLMTRRLEDILGLDDLAAGLLDTADRKARLSTIIDRRDNVLISMFDGVDNGVEVDGILKHVAKGLRDKDMIRLSAQEAIGVKANYQFFVVFDFMENHVDTSVTNWAIAKQRQLDSLEAALKAGGAIERLDLIARTRENRAAMLSRLRVEVDELTRKINVQNSSLSGEKYAAALYDRGIDRSITDTAAFQRALKKWSNGQSDALVKAEALFNEHDLVLREWVRAVYDRTQAELKFVGGAAAHTPKFAETYAREYAQRAGYANIILLDGREIIVDRRLRGLASARTLREGTKDFLEAVGVVDLSDWAKITQPVDRIGLWRGHAKDISTAEKVGSFFGRMSTVRMQPANSTSTSPFTALNFTVSQQGPGRMGLLSHMWVDKRQILATNRTGPGCFCEHEALLLGGPVETVTWAFAEGARPEFYEVLKRMAASGMIDDDGLREWARLSLLSNSRNANKGAWFPTSDDAKGLGWQAVDILSDPQVLEELSDRALEQFVVDPDEWLGFWHSRQFTPESAALFNEWIEGTAQLHGVDDASVWLETLVHNELRHAKVEILNALKGQPFIGSGEITDYTAAAKYMLAHRNDDEIFDDILDDIFSLFTGDVGREAPAELFHALEQEFGEWYHETFFDDFFETFLNSVGSGGTYYEPGGFFDDFSLPLDLLDDVSLPVPEDLLR